jgi:hypothetical protein
MTQKAITSDVTRFEVLAVTTPLHKDHGVMPLGPGDCPFPIIPWSEAPSWNSWGYGIEAKGLGALGVGHGDGLALFSRRGYLQVTL